MKPSKPSSSRTRDPADLPLIGWREWVGLPDLATPKIKAKVDTGARSSSLHAWNIEPFRRRGADWVRFVLHPDQRSMKKAIAAEAPVLDRRSVKSSSGEKEERYVIKTYAELLDQRWPIEVTLTRRDEMGFRMLLGRQAIRGRFLVDSGHSYNGGKPRKKKALSKKKASMNISILSRNPRLYSTTRLREAAQERGHEVRVIDYLRCFMNITSNSPKVMYGDEPVVADAVIPRIGASRTFYGTAIVRQFEVMGVFPGNPSQAISRSRDKLRSLQILSSAGVGLPVTGFASSPKDVDALIELVGGAPLIIKLLEGTQGVGVVLAETKKAAESVIAAFKQLQANILVQEFIKEAGGADIRAFVVGDKVVAAMKRQGPPGEFRSNIHRGGSAEKIKLTPEERATAVKSAKAMGLFIAGVDMLQAERGPLVMEVNSSPGLEGIERSTGVDVAGKVIEFIEKNAGSRKTKDRGRF